MMHIWIRYIYREREITPNRALRAEFRSDFTVRQPSISSFDLRVSDIRSEIPGPKLGFTFVIHSPWFFLNSYLQLKRKFYVFKKHLDY